LDQRQVGAGVLQHHRLVDHGELQVGGGVVHRQPPGLGHHHDGEGGGGEQAGRGGDPQRVVQRGGDDRGQVRRAYPGGQGEDRDEDGRFDQRQNGDLPAGPHPTARGTRGQGRQGGGRRAQAER